jgi:peptidoglycan/xylan/chitin deacetylase (PgdA/CDA1 family)
LWPDELFARILSWNSSSIRLPDGQLESVPAAYERTALAFRILQSCKDSPHERRLEWLDYLRESTPGAKVKLVPQAQDFMSWEEARTLVERGFELGSHTVAHPILSRISMAQLSRELKESRTAVEAKTGGRCIAIAYPNGSLMDYTPEVQQAVQQAGYEFGFVVSGHWSRRPLERFAIDRIPPPGHADAGTFAFHASGARALFGGE